MAADQQYPDDENGDVLRRMAESGVDLHSPRVIDFEHRFSSKRAAERFRDAVAGDQMDVVITPPDSDDDRSWQVTCRQRMVPTHRGITDTELRLGKTAEQFGGFADGWGSLSNADGSPAR